MPLPYVGSLVGIVLLLVLGPASGTAVGEAPSEHTTGAAQDRQEPLEQPIDRSPTGQPGDTAVDHETLPMPVNRELADGGGVQVFADSAHIVIRWDAGPNPAYVTAQWSLEGPSGELLLSSRGGDTVLRYVADATVEGYPIIELHLAPIQRAAVFGSSLSVDALETSQNDSQPPNGPDGPPETSQLVIEAVRSDLTLTDIPHLTVKGEESVLFARGGIGPWTIDFVGGSSELVDHRGTLQFTGQHTEVAFQGNLGPQTLDVSESALFIRGGGGSINATTSGGSIECDEVTGSLTITGASTSVALRRLNTSRLALTGEHLFATMEDGQGRARVTLDGGELSVTRWAPRIDLTARSGATVTINELGGDFAFTAMDGASVRVSSVTGHVRGRATDTTIEASALKSIQLQAIDSDITVDTTRHLTVFDLTNSTARLNLYELRGAPEISLGGSSRADIELHYPCQVRVEGPGAKSPGRIAVNGCENLRPEQSWAPPQSQRHGEKPIEPIHLTIKMDQRSHVSVTGY